MIQELVELWSWFYGMVAGWGTTTLLMLCAISMLWVKHLRLQKRIDILYSRLVAFEREYSIEKNRDNV